MAIKDLLKQIKQELTHKRLTSALNLLDDIITANMSWGLADRMKNIRDTYTLMLDAVEHGQDDPKLDDNFYRLLREAYALYAEAKWRVRTEQNHDILADVNPQLFTKNIDDIAAELRQGHSQEYVNDLFLIFTNQPLWTKDDTRAMTDLLLSEDIDSKDKQMIVTAIMMSAMGTFDLQKTLCLAKTYKETQDIYVRTRALVGWVMSLDIQMITLWEEERELVRKMTSDDEDTLQDLFKLQVQIIYCMCVAKDSNIINKDILPNIMNGSKKSGIPSFDIRIIEDPESIEDFTEREESEKQIEQLEENAEKMMNMQKEGSDIYFGGFASMKDFEFFKTLPNWFCPFYYEHPKLDAIHHSNVPEEVVRGLLSAVPFCDSDKYSFALAMNMVLGKIPPKMLELLGQGEIKNLADVVGIPKDAIILRNYLQDLFRFYRISTYRNKFTDPFSNGRYLFISNPLFIGTGVQERFFTPIARLLQKKDLTDDMEQMILTYKSAGEDESFMALAAKHYMKRGLYEYAETYYRYLLNKDSNNRAYLTGLAKAYFMQKNYGAAMLQYQQLTELFPDDYRLQLNKAICQTYIKEEIDDAMKTLSRLYYEHPDDDNIVRAYAWGNLINKQLSQAISRYKETDDHLNHAFALWFNGQREEALDQFEIHIKNSKEKISVEDLLLNETFILSHFNVDDTQFHLLTALIQRKVNTRNK